MRFLGWYLKIAASGATIGGAMELFMIHTGFYEKVMVLESMMNKIKDNPRLMRAVSYRSLSFINSIYDQRDNGID
ncbi:hypothetical protein GUJ93_ZPchr0011g27487 [Zizania palustris]|uniref:Uncharacterized protein n=1 Tax=Zizania palustris TaxID=103762 RepID=A0A8J5WDW8_ZIZPA|nr:hypothetical protein GUJ93_ZPchr0011g27487 [Zizania palustris]